MVFLIGAGLLTAPKQETVGLRLYQGQETLIHRWEEV